MIRTEELKKRYTRVEEEIDTLNRIFKVGLLTPSQRNRLYELAESSSPELIYRLMMVASVRAVVDPEDNQEVGFAFPDSRSEIDQRSDMFDTEGLVAISAAYTRLAPPKKPSGGPIQVEAKN